MNLREVEKLRSSHYRIGPNYRVRTLAAAARYIDRFGFCWLFASSADVPELPSLFEAMKGRRGVHIEDWDEDSDRLWSWKNDLPAERLAYYGKGLMGRPALVSLKFLPYLLACAGDESFRQLYARGGISYEAKAIYDVLDRLGPQPTTALRRAAGLDSKGGNVRYHRALDELQRRLYILPVGATSESGPWVSQIFELTARWFPEQVEQARTYDVREARRLLVDRYLKTVLAAKPAGIARLFNIPRDELNQLLRELASARRVRFADDWVHVSLPRH